MSIKSIWPKIYQKIKTPPAGVQLGEISSKLPPIGKFTIEDVKLKDDANAIGYVSTEDVDSNGKIDTIHISSPRLEEALRNNGITISDLQKIDSLSDQELVRVLQPFIELISHELAHIKDYSHQHNKFPGGESVAESAGQRAIKQISLKSSNTTNNKNFNRFGSSFMNLKKLKTLAKIAERFDKKGEHEVSSFIDSMLEKYSQLLPPHVSRKGKITRAGDPYTYDYFPKTKTFTVVSAPAGHEASIGAVIKPGDKGYESLMETAVAMKLEVPPSVPSTPAKSTQPVVPTPLKKVRVQSSLSEFADQVKATIPMGIVGGTATQLEESLDKLKSPTINAKDAKWFFDGTIVPLLNVSGFEPSKVEAIKKDFNSRIAEWPGYTQSSKEDLEKVFWFNSKTPFYRK